MSFTPPNPTGTSTSILNTSTSTATTTAPSTSTYSSTTSLPYATSSVSLALYNSPLWQRTLDSVDTHDFGMSSSSTSTTANGNSSHSSSPFAHNHPHAHSLPLARIKKIMKSDEDVRMISAEAPILFAKACELFIVDLCLRSWQHTNTRKARTMQRNDVSQAIHEDELFDFLWDIIPKSSQEGDDNEADNDPNEADDADQDSENDNEGDESDRRSSKKY